MRTAFVCLFLFLAACGGKPETEAAPAPVAPEPAAAPDSAPAVDPPNPAVAAPGVEVDTSDSPQPPPDSGSFDKDPVGRMVIGELMHFNENAAMAGSHGISGAVILPEGTKAGLGVQLVLNRYGGGFGQTESITEVIGMTDGKPVQRYKIEGLGAGKYQLSLRVDADDDKRYDQSGDLLGYYTGVANLAAARAEDAQLIVVDEGKRIGQDLSLAAIP